MSVLDRLEKDSKTAIPPAILGEGKVWDIRHFGTLSRAISVIGTETATLYITKQVTITSNTTVPSNISIVVVKGGSFSIATGVTLTINGPFQAGLYTCFTWAGTGDARFGYEAASYAEWFGATADGSTDDGASINKAIDSLQTYGGRVYLGRKKTYAVHAGNNRVKIRSDVYLDLNGATLQRIGTNYSNNLVENYTYAPGTAYDSNVGIGNGTLKGSGVSSQTITLSASGYTNFVVGDIGKLLVGSTGGSATITAYNNAARTVTVNSGVDYSGTVSVTAGVGGGTISSTDNSQSHTVPAANVFWFGVNGFVIENLKSDTANGDCLGWRLANDGYVDRVVGGSFGRNLFSPTSGVGNRVTNCNLDFSGLTGAAPGAYIDTENDAADEVSDVYYENVITKGAVFVDFWTTSGGDFAHKARFVNCQFSGDSPRTISIQSTNPTVARGFVIGDSCRVAVAVNTAAAVKISQVSGVICNAYLANDSGSQGRSKAIWIAGSGSARNAASGGIFSLAGIAGFGSFATKTLTITNTVSAGSETITWTSTAVTIAVQAGVSTIQQALAGTVTGTPWANLAQVSANGTTVAALASTAMASLTAYDDGATENIEFNGRVAVDEFSTGLYAVDVPVKNSRFTGMFLGDVQLREGSSGNVFTGCKVGVLTIIDSGSNDFKDCNITGGATITTNSGAVTAATSNDFTGCTLTNITFSGSATINNRFRTDTRITGTKTFNSSSTWLGQIFEKEEGSFTPTVTGSSSGSATITGVWGRYSVLGDLFHWAMTCQITATTGVGEIRVNLNPPNSIVPADGSSPSRWPVIFFGYNFAFTGSQVVGFMSGGAAVISLYGVDNAGTLTAVPATIATGYFYLQGSFRLR